MFYEELKSNIIHYISSHPCIQCHTLVDNLLISFLSTTPLKPSETLPDAYDTCIKIITV